jgi:hypothetical protein
MRPVDQSSYRMTGRENSRPSRSLTSLQGNNAGPIVWVIYREGLSSLQITVRLTLATSIPGVIAEWNAQWTGPNFVVGCKGPYQVFEARIQYVNWLHDVCGGVEG